MEKKNTVTLYAARQNVWGATNPRTVYFETIQQRNAFVKENDYTEKAGTVKITAAQYEQFKACGTWDRYAN